MRKIEIIKFNPVLSTEEGKDLLPATGHEDDAGIDCYALEPISLPAITGGGNDPKPVCVPLGFGIKMPKRTILDRILHRYWHAELTSRSSQNKRGVMVLRGIIDQSYLGEYIVCLVNLNDYPVRYEKGERICQILFYKEIKPNCREIRVLKKTKRKAGGFGSTGK
jgi:dUTP pyrophosphatase